MLNPRIPSANPGEEYTRRLGAGRTALAAREKRHGNLGNLRLLVVLAAIAMAFAAYNRGAFSGWWLVVPVAVFLWLGGRLQRVETERSVLSRAVTFYERSLARLDGHWAGTGEKGDRFLDEHHLYAQDLDIFGAASLFELLSTARTRMGEQTLAAWLKSPAPPNTVRARQEAVAELAPNLDLREDIAVLGEDARAGVHPEALAAWGEREALLKSSPFRVAALGLSLFGAIAAVALITYLVAWLGLLELADQTMLAMRMYMLSVFALVGSVVWRFKGRTQRIIQEVEEAAHDLGLLAGVLSRLEGERFVSPRLEALRAELDSEGQPPSRCIKRLDGLMGLLDSRDNQIFGWIAPLLLWDLHLCYALEDWRRTSGPAMRRWLNALGEMEAISSLASFRYDRPTYVFPEFVAESPYLEGEALAHPLLGTDGVVPNDVRISGDLRVLAVSGSNMSGKSTLLRTVGVNAVLAQAGGSVRARGLRYASGDVRIPRFLLNDLTRYWRTVTVDFVYKQRAENDDKWALRNAKLRMSRKLVFAAGLLHCFFCHLDPAAESAREALKTAPKDVSALTAYMEDQLSLTPLDLVAKACLQQNVKPETARSIFDSYDRFLSILDDSEKRSELALARTHDQLRESPAWKEVREVSRPFHDGLVDLFLNDNENLTALTMKYGVF